MRRELSRVKEPNKYDFVLLSIIGIMAILSLLAIWSAFELITADVPTTLLMKQVMWYGFGIIAMGAIMYLGNDTIRSFVKIAYWILIALLIYLLVSKFIFTRFLGIKLPFVNTVNGATSWFLFPVIGTLQPSEFIKVVLVLMTADIIDQHNSEKVIDSYESDLQLFWKIIKIAVPPMVLIFLQPDTGICIIIFISLAVMIMCSGIKKTWIIGGFAAIFLILGIFFYMYFFNKEFLSSLFGGGSNYKLDRIESWLNPEADTLGNGMQLYYALMVIGSAGLTGHGFQQFLLGIPEAQTDFIFAVIGQSWGLIGTLFTVGLCLALDLRLIRIAMLSKITYEKYYIAGILGMLLFQQIENMGMIIGLLPITGITLPFISYGGSSLLSYFLALGVIMNASSHAKKLSDYIYN